MELPQFLQPLPPDSPATTLFLAYEDEALLGFASLPLDDTPELVGAVHPAHRRRGIGRQLVLAALGEVRRRGCKGLVLVGEVASPAGLAFAQALGGIYDCAEYQLELRRSGSPPAVSGGQSLEVVAGSRQDAPLLARIGAEAFGAGNSSSVARIARGFDNPGQRYYIAKAAGEPVGSLRVARDPEAPTAYIYAFGIRQAYQRRGYGRWLLTTMVARLFAEGCEAVRLEVETNNSPAFALYRSCGFQPVTEYRYFRLPV